MALPGPPGSERRLESIIFIAIGLAAQRLLRLAEKNPNYGFGVILLSVIFLSGFLFVSLIFAAEILHALSWPAVLAGSSPSGR